MNLSFRSSLKNFLTGLVISIPLEYFYTDKALAHSNSSQIIIEDKVDCIEINHILNQKTGEYGQSYLLFWETEKKTGKPKIVAWRRYEPKNIPMKNHRGYDYLFHDPKDAGKLRRIFSQRLMETWTTEDPEIINRRYDFPESTRRGFSQRMPNSLKCER